MEGYWFLPNSAKKMTDPPISDAGVVCFSAQFGRIGSLPFDYQEKSTPLTNDDVNILVYTHSHSQARTHTYKVYM